MGRGEQHGVFRESITIVELVVFAALALLPLIAEYYQTVFATRILILAFLALSFDLVWGFAGVMSFGQAVFYGGAGYLSVVVARDLDIASVFVLLPLGLVFGAALAFLIGLFLLLGSSSSRMIFIALGTLIFSYTAERLARGWELLGGQNGIFNFPPLSVFGEDLYEGTGFYYLAFGLLAVAYLVIRALTRSQFGLAMAAIRENPERARHFGYRVGTLKIIVFVVAGGLAGIGGVLASFHDAFIAPPTVGVVLSTQAVIYVLLGGAGTRIGALIGVIIIEGMSFWLTDAFQQVWPIILAALLLLVIMVRPSGLISLLASESERAGSFGQRMRGSK